MTTTNKPTHSLFVVEGDGDTARWTRIGSAWPNKDGLGYSMQLAAAPVTGRLVMRANKPQPETAGALL